MTLISLKNIFKIYNVGGEEVRALDGIDLDILENEYQTIPANSKEEISAILATQELAQKLRIRVKDPILFRKRLVLDDANRVIEYNFCYYLATDFKYEITIKKPNLY